MRPDSERKALTPNAVRELLQATLGLRDPELHLLVIVFSLQSGARIMGVARLRIVDVLAAPFVTLREKRNRVRRVPISDELRRALLVFAVRRGARGADDRVFRGLKGRPVQRKEMRRQLQKLRELACSVPGSIVPAGFSHHWLRHTAINSYAQASGSMALAAHFAGHKLKPKLRHHWGLHPCR